MASHLQFPGLCLFAMVSAMAEQQPNKEEFLTRIVSKSLGSWHYSPPKLDDAFGRKVFTLYLKRLDPQKRFLLQQDVDSLKRFESTIDDEIKQGSYLFFENSSGILRKRIKEAEATVKSILDGPLNLAAEDSLPADPEKQAFSKSKDELRQRWSRLLKYQILSHIQDTRESQEKEKKDAKPDLKVNGKSKEKGAKNPEKSKAATSVKSWEEQEKDARQYVARSLHRVFERSLKEDRLERLSAYLNTISNSHDPHTEYFKPEAKEDFDLSMTGTLEGIGAVLREEDGFIKVVSIVPGSASWRQKELKAEDKILKVAQGRDEPVDLVEASVNEAVRLIRGRKGTEVRLTVEKPSGSIDVISIVRDVVVVEETYAKSVVLSPALGKGRIGYINLPAFYHDFNNSKGRNASGDVKDELAKLKDEKVGGIILGLRNNGGGALDDAVKMAGLFFRNGPVVQIKDQKGSAMVLNDQDTSTTYDGPLVVMINTFSASASEIVAAALQDYGRAVILGTDTSFGKGTVQSMMDLDAYLPPMFQSLKPMGSLKLTIQKFYRINGGSTQYKGVVPDILIPDAYTNLDVGEKTLEYAMPWDTVEALSFTRWAKVKPDVGELRKRSAARLKGDPYYREITSLVDKLQGKRERAWLSLNKTKFFEEQETARKDTEKFETLQKESAALSVTALKGKAPADSVEVEKGKHWQEQLARDFYLREAVSVITDMAVR